MHDAIDWQAIPADAAAVAGYVDGRLSVWPREAWQRFTTPRVLHISTWGPRNLGDTLDIEAGDSIPEDAPAWVENALQRGVAHPKLYMGLWDFPLVRSLTAQYDVRYWVAHYTGIPHLPAGADGCQYDDQPRRTGGDFDLSVCLPRLFD